MAAGRGVSEVIIHEDESFERALERFKKQCEKAGILAGLRTHRHYGAPSAMTERRLPACATRLTHPEWSC